MKTVVEAIQDLGLALDMNYMRNGIKIMVEPDIFYRLQNEIHGKAAMDAVSPKNFHNDKIDIYTPAGRIEIVRDGSLGKSGYVKVWNSDD